MEDASSLNKSRAQVAISNVHLKSKIETTDGAYARNSQDAVTVSKSEGLVVRQPGTHVAASVPNLKATKESNNSAQDSQIKVEEKVNGISAAAAASKDASDKVTTHGSVAAVEDPSDKLCSVASVDYPGSIEVKQGDIALSSLNQKQPTPKMPFADIAHERATGISHEVSKDLAASSEMAETAIACRQSHKINEARSTEKGLNASETDDKKSTVQLNEKPAGKSGSEYMDVQKRADEDNYSERSCVVKPPKMMVMPSR